MKTLTKITKKLTLRVMMTTDKREILEYVKTLVKLNTFIHAQMESLGAEDVKNLSKLQDMLETMLVEL